MIDGTSKVDLTTPYGYGGAFYWGGDREGVATPFWSAFDRWAYDRGVVTMFIREALLRDSVLEAPGERVVKQDNIVVDLRQSETERWMAFEHKVRKNVNKAARSGVTVEVDSDPRRFDAFLAIYNSTMDRRGAASSYYFGTDFFHALNTGLPGQYVYAYALHGGVVISAELALVSAEAMYSFLGGTDDSAFALRPNDALKVELMRWGAAHGKRSFVLGGGYEPGDGIFKYKRAFSPHGATPFSVVTRVFDKDEYEKLVEAHVGPQRGPKSEGFFPAYRVPTVQASSRQGNGS
jgi:Uncharacterized protein conserved in bacteria